MNSEAGISYTEFSYQILQGFDYLELYRQYGCVLQTGGSDQWGNLTSGTDLIHKVEGVSVHAIGTPLVMNADGTKFGKSEGNAIWLDAAMCTPYRFYQFWLNTEDADVVSRLKVFTFLSRERIEELAGLVEREPFRREAQRVLAHEVTTLVHGADATAAVIAASQALFGQGDLGGTRSRHTRSSAPRAPEHHDLAGCLDRPTARRHRTRREPERGSARHRPGRRVPRQRARRRRDRDARGACAPWGHGRAAAWQEDPRRRLRRVTIASSEGDEPRHARDAT